MRRIAALISLAALVACFAGRVAAAEKKGKLEGFEGEIEKSEPRRHEDGRDHRHDHERRGAGPAGGTEIAAEGFMSVFYSFFLTGLGMTGAVSSKEMYEELKLSESPALPTIKVDASYQYVFDGIHGAAGKVEAGYLMLGAQAEYIRYMEGGARDLDFISGHGLLRTLFAQFLGVNLAMGVKSLKGANWHSGFEFGFPSYIYFTRHLTLDIQPYMAFINGKNVYDITGGLAYKYKAVGARAFYRMIKTGGETIHGPGGGLFIQW
ncbi:MAG: hypothetical protein JXA24_01240 [Proteobacteria bacterium]|nr:hypothetical protein [Pseudomonadota bacterium]